MLLLINHDLLLLGYRMRGRQSLHRRRCHRQYLQRQRRNQCPRVTDLNISNMLLVRGLPPQNLGHVLRTLQMRSFSERPAQLAIPRTPTSVRPFLQYQPIRNTPERIEHRSLNSSDLGQPVLVLVATKVTRISPHTAKSTMPIVALPIRTKPQSKPRRDLAMLITKRRWWIGPWKGHGASELDPKTAVPGNRINTTKI